MSRVSPRAVVIASCLAALAVFAVVQDRITAGGARRYVVMQRESLSGRGQPVTIDEIMGPAIESSVRQGALWGGLVLVTGLVLAARLRGNTRE